ncbi:MAG: PadR family transcriptional regulator [bacterium]
MCNKKNNGHHNKQTKKCRCTDDCFQINNFVIPCLLLLLKEQPDHGYKLQQRLKKLPFLYEIPASGVIYRHLRCLEEDGLIKSQLKPGSGGPARKVYSLTAKGESYLKKSRGIIREKKEALNGFLKKLKNN